MAHVVLVALEPGQHSERALDSALNTSAERGGRLHVVTVVGGYDPFQKLEYAAEKHQLHLEREKAELEARVQAARARFSGAAAPAPVVELHVLVGPPAKEILRLARKLGASLLVVGRGKRALKAVLGSVAQDVLREASCSVLVVPD